jgi:FkbM family methyltransferase
VAVEQQNRCVEPLNRELTLPRPLRQTSGEFRDIRETRVLLSLAALLQRYLPRGAGAVPRWIGKALLRMNSQYLVTRHGTKLVLSPGSLDVYATMRLGNNSWDYHDFLTCVAASPDGTTFYDIGANVGYFSLEMAPLTNGSVRVVAFEPQSTLASAIRSSADLNKFENIIVFDVLVGNITGESNFFPSAASIHASAVADSGRKPKRVVRKQMVRIDDLVESGSILPPDFVKMDVEGSEHLVFRGARRTFEQYKPHIFLEYGDDYPPSRQIRREIESLLSASVDYDLFGHPPSARAKNYSHTFFRMRHVQDWLDVDSLFLKNRKRPVRNGELFEP